jgi:hypothetical protein
MIIKSKLIPQPFWAFTAWPFIVVRPEHADDKGIIVHESVHYKEQAWITPFWWLRYALSKKFRLDAEVRAYKAQININALTKEQAAYWLIKYDSALTLADAIKRF